MQWKRYRGVVGWLFLAGAILGGLFFLLFGRSDDVGEEGALITVLLAVFGAVMGLIATIGPAACYAVCMSVWADEESHSPRKLGGIGVTGAAIGVLLSWAIFAFSTGMPLVAGPWMPIVLFAVLIAGLVAGPLTILSSRRH